MFIPGLGQILSGRILKGIIQFTLFILFLFVIVRVWNGFNLGFFAFLVGIILYWIYIFVDAYAYYDKRTAPCEKACPVGLDIPGYIDLALRGEFEEAKESIYHRSPFIGTLSYICHEPCKKWCARRSIDVPLEIRAIKRYIFEKAQKTVFKFKKRFDEKIAVIGAGPSGLSCAFFLARLGYEVDVIDVKKEPGGTLKEFIPEYRLPSNVLKRDIEEILSTDLINFKGGIMLGRDVSLKELKNDYSSIYIATGAWGRRSIGIIGEEKKGVFHALDFLKGIKTGKVKKMYGTVIVIGGGDVAADVARSAIRLSVHKRVILAYRRSKREMRIDDVEISEMEEEGVSILENVIPVEIKGKDAVEKIVFRRTRVIDNEVVPLDEYIEKEASYVIMSIGQKVHVVSRELATEPDGRIKVDKEMLTSEEMVFAGGDAVRGPSSLVESIRDGREAARNIHKKLNSSHYFKRDFLFFVPIHKKPQILLKFKKPVGEHVPLLREPYNERVLSFKPVELCYSDDKAIEECSRCLGCSFRYN